MPPAPSVASSLYDAYCFWNLDECEQQPEPSNTVMEQRFLKQFEDPRGDKTGSLLHVIADSVVVQRGEVKVRVVDDLLLLAALCFSPGVTESARACRYFLSLTSQVQGQG